MSVNRLPPYAFVHVPPGELPDVGRWNVLDEVAFQGPFLRRSCDALYPETAGLPVDLTSFAPLSTGKGRFNLFRVTTRFAGGLTRSLLCFASQGRGLAGHYRTITERGRGDPLVHEFGREHETPIGPRGPAEAPFQFTVNFHEGAPVSEAAVILRRLVGIPGLLTADLGRSPVSSLEEDASRLVDLGLLDESGKAALLEARAVRGSEALTRVQERLRSILFELDAGAVRACFEFYRKTGYAGDPRRENCVFRTVDGKRVFRPIDYEGMNPVVSPFGMISLFCDVFVRKLPDGSAPEINQVRLWSWSFLDDKTGFFQAVVDAFGETEGLSFLGEAAKEYRGKTDATPDERERASHLLRFLLRKGALRAATDTGITRCPPRRVSPPTAS